MMIKKVIGIIMLGTATAAIAQTTTNTNCNVYGSTVSCTSNTIDYGEQNRQAYAAGQQVGNAIGLLIARGIEAHRFHSAIKKECAQRGQGAAWQVQNSWTGQQMSGICPLKKEKKAPPVQAVVSTQSLPVSKPIPVEDELSAAETAKVEAITYDFMARHTDYIACPENAEFIKIYMLAHVKTDLPTAADFDEAYAALKPTGVLKLRNRNQNW